MDAWPGLFLAALVGLGTAKPRRPAPAAKRHIVLAHPTASLDDCARYIEAAGAKLHQVLPIVHGIVCSCPGPASLQALSGHDSISMIEPDWRVALPIPGRRTAIFKAMSLLMLPSPTRRETVPWGVERIGSPAAWSRTRGEGVRVAVVDTGVDTDHPDLLPNLRGGFNVFNPDGAPQDDSGHGTHVAGIIAAVDNDRGVIGVAPRCDLFAVKAFDAAGTASTSDVLTALQWCADYEMQIVNMSFGQTEDSPSVARALAALGRRGTILVSAAGNDAAAEHIDFPARDPAVIAVTGSDRSDRVMHHASRGPEVDLIAPGESIISLGLGDSLRYRSGTSMAAPHVAGAAALLLSTRPGLSAAAVRRHLETTAKVAGESNSGSQRAGLVRVDLALAQLLGHPISADTSQNQE